eukprot:Gb_12415 [translate_table: standard]
MAPGNMIYDECEHPRMGVVRESYAKNPLMVKPKLGTVKRVTQDIHDEDYIYGVITEFGTEGAKEVMVHEEPLPQEMRVKRGPDFMAMNKAATMSNCVKASDQRQFREENRIPLHVKRLPLPECGCVQKKTPNLPSDKNPDFVYGRPVQREEPITNIVKQAYANDWIKMNMAHQHEFGKETLPGCRRLTAKTTKSTELYARTQQEKTIVESQPPSERFILSKFKNIPSKIDNIQTTPLQRD